MFSFVYVFGRTRRSQIHVKLLPGAVSVCDAPSHFTLSARASWATRNMGLAQALASTLDPQPKHTPQLHPALPLASPVAALPAVFLTAAF